MSVCNAPVAVIVVSWNSASFLDDCLTALRRLERPPAEVVVVDNGSTDGSADRVRRRYPEVALVPCDVNAGFCRANNIGIRLTRSPFVLALNPDTRLEPDFLERLLPAFDDPRVGTATGKLLRFDGRSIDSAGQLLARSRQPRDRGYGRPDRGQFDRDDEVFGACGAAALYRRAMLESIADPGGEIFDEAFFAFFEDLDLAWRSRRLGWKAVYRHRAVGYHARGGTETGARRLRAVAAMLARSPEIRFHVVKNRFLTMVRNDSLAGYAKNLPFIWARDLATLALVCSTCPGVLPALWRSRALLRRAWQRRKLDAARARHQVPLRGPGLDDAGSEAG